MAVVSGELQNVERNACLERLACAIIASCSGGAGSQRVMALRFLRLAARGALAEREARRMITEKAVALGEAQTAAAIATIKGGDSRHVAKKILRVFRREC